MKPDFTKLTQLIAARPNWNPSGERNDKRRTADAEIGDEGEYIVAKFIMETDQNFNAEKITRSGFDRLAHPAGCFLREDPDDGDLFLDHFVSFDLLISGPTNFKAEVKVKPFQGSGSGRYYPLDRIRLQRMRKAYHRCSNMPHLFVIIDTKRTEAPAHGLFAAPVDQLLTNASDYPIQIGHAEPFYRIPVTEFRPLSHFLEQHNQSKDYTHANIQKPLSCINAAA